ncbi:hypothetical protein ACFJIW_14845 [Tahibacter sp. UC22_41]|uniref:hypothetical protein n=1 Tax=Tahibacter sp. UC22_41 TaxID=3350178 RepID=UPI0036D82730
MRRFRLLPQSDAQRALFASDIQWNVTQLPRRPRGRLPRTMSDRCTAVAPGPAGNGDCDWTCLRDVTIRAVERG